MIVKEEHFRNLYKTPVIIKDEEFSRQIAQTLLVHTIKDDELSDEEFGQRLKSIEVDENVNAILAIPYIDHTAGMSFLCLSTASLTGDSAHVYRRDDFSGMNIVRKDSVNDFEFRYLDDLELNDDFDLADYEEHSSIADHYYVNDRVEALRFIEFLDDARNGDYPDDFLVIFVKDGCQMEQMWVRCEDFEEGQIIIGTLLNEPYQDFGVNAGDEVRFFPYKPEGQDKVVLICDLN